MFEIQTFALTLLTLLFASLTVLLVNWRIHRKMRGPGYWAAGAASRFMGMALVASGSLLPGFVGGIFGHFLVILGDVLAVAGLSVFASRPPYRRSSLLLLTIVLSALVYFTYNELIPYARLMTLVIGHIIAMLMMVLLQIHIFRKEGMNGVLVLAISSFWEIFLAPLLLLLIYLASRDVELEVQLVWVNWVQPMGAIASIGILQTFGFMLLAAHRTENELRNMALLDTLTGIPNRRAFDGAMRRAVESTRRSGTCLGLLVMDIDFFKKVNDIHGHTVGDEMLRHVAQTIANCLRETDFFARTGGEEFALIVTNTTETALHEVAERFRLAVQNQALLRPRDAPLSATLSIGLALSAPGHVEADALYSCADSALYRAKQNGRNRVEAAA